MPTKSMIEQASYYKKNLRNKNKTLRAIIYTGKKKINK